MQLTIDPGNGEHLAEGNHKSCIRHWVAVHKLENVNARLELKLSFSKILIVECHHQTTYASSHWQSGEEHDHTDNGKHEWFAFLQLLRIEIDQIADNCLDDGHLGTKAQCDEH